MKSDFLTKETGNPDFKKIFFCWDITTSCQYRCKYCYALPWLTKPSKITNVDAYKIVLPRLKMKSMPKFDIEILGGEPMLHPKIDYILEDICLNGNSDRVTMNTNGLISLKKIKHLTGKGLNVSISFHPGSVSNIEKFCNTLKETQQFGFLGKQLSVNINIYDNIEYISKYKKILEFCSNNNILAGANYLFETKSYNPNYSDEFFNKLYSEIQTLNKIPISWSMDSIRWVGVSGYRHPSEKSVRFVDHNDNVTYKTMGEIRDYKLNKWKNYNCRSKLWQIDSNGVIKNDCTGKLLDFTNKNINECVKCPKDNCGVAEVQYSFHKTAPGQQEPIN